MDDVLNDVQIMNWFCTDAVNYLYSIKKINIPKIISK